MRADLDLSYVELGWVVAAFGVARLLVDLPAGGLGSRWNPRTVLMLAFAGSAAASALAVLAGNVWQIAGVRLLIGAASSVAQAMILAWLVGGSGRAARGRVMAHSEAFFSVTGLVIPALGGLLAGTFGWRVAFVLGAVAAVVGLLAVLGFTGPSTAARAVGLDDTRSRTAAKQHGAQATAHQALASEPSARAAEHGASATEGGAPTTEHIAPGSEPGPRGTSAKEHGAPATGHYTPAKHHSAEANQPGAKAGQVGMEREPEPGWLALRNGGPMLLSAYLATFVVFFSRNGLLNAGFPVLGADKLGLEPFQIGLLFSTLNAVSIGAVLLGGRLGDQYGRYRMLGPGLVLLLASQVLMFLITDQVTYVIVGLIQGLAAFVNPLPTSLLGDALPPRQRARGIAVYRAVCDMALLSAPAVLGLTLQLGGFAAAELVTASTTLAVIIVIWTVGNPQRQTVPRAA